MDKETQRLFAACAALEGMLSGNMQTIAKAAIARDESSDQVWDHVAQDAQELADKLLARLEATRDA